MFQSVRCQQRGELGLGLLGRLGVRVRVRGSAVVAVGPYLSTGLAARERVWIVGEWLSDNYWMRGLAPVWGCIRGGCLCVRGERRTNMSVSRRAEGWR